MTTRRSKRLDSSAAAESKTICRICLATNRTKMFDMKESNWKVNFKRITGLNVGDDDKFPRLLCWECAHRLAECSHLRSRARLAHCLMEDLLKSDGFISEKNINNINRHKNGLESRLVENSTVTFSVGDDDIEPNEDNIDQYYDDIETLEEYIDENFDYIEPNENNIDHNYFEIENEDYIELDQDDIKSSLDVDLEDDVKTPNDIDKLTDDIIKEEVSSEIKMGKQKSSQALYNSERILVKRRYRNTAPDDVIKQDIRPEVSTGKIMKEKRESEENIKLEHIKDNLDNDEEDGSDEDVKPKDEIDETIIKETKLTLEEQRQEIENRKNSTNYKRSPLKCQLCFKGYVDEDAFKLHNYRHSDERGPYQCGICKLRYKSKRILRVHQAKHTFRYSCRLCSFKCVARSHAHKHPEFHKGHTFKCTKCDKQFFKISTYLGHLRRSHPTRFVCSLCGNFYISEKGLHQHRMLKHPLDKDTVPQEEHACDNCDLKFATIQARDTHAFVSHGVSYYLSEEESARRRRLYQRRKCMGYIKKTLMKRKQERRVGDIQCEQCDAVLPDAKSYYWHFRRAHPGKTRTYYPTATKSVSMCEVCGRIFQNRSHLRQHMESHSRDQRHRCAHCEETFRTAFLLNSHIQTHKDVERPVYRCMICDAPIMLLGNMRRHLLRHMEPPMHVCTTCGKRFTNRYNMQAHHRHVHQGLPWPKRTPPKRPRPHHNTTMIPLVDTEDVDMWSGVEEGSNDSAPEILLVKWDSS